MSDAEIGEVAPVLGRAADLHVADDHAPESEPPEPAKELSRAWKEPYARDGGHAQRASDGEDVHFSRIAAKETKGAGELAMRVLNEHAISLVKLTTQYAQRVRCVDVRQQPPEPLQAGIGGHLRGEPIGPQGAAHIQQHRPEHSWMGHDPDPAVQPLGVTVTSGRRRRAGDPGSDAVIPHEGPIRPAARPRAARGLTWSVAEPGILSLDVEQELAGYLARAWAFEGDPKATELGP